MAEKIVVVLNIKKRNESHDVEVPLDITANDLVLALNSAYGLQIDTDDITKRYLKTENPIALLKGGRLLSEYKLKNGTCINVE